MIDVCPGLFRRLRTAARKLRETDMCVPSSGRTQPNRREVANTMPNVIQLKLEDYPKIRRPAITISRHGSCPVSMYTVRK